MGLKIDDGSNKDEVTACITIKMYRNGAMSVEGPVEDTAFCLAALDNARDAVRNHKSRRETVVIPSYDLSVPDPLHPLNVKP
jgi:hypothetical protein